MEADEVDRQELDDSAIRIVDRFTGAGRYAFRPDLPVGDGPLRPATGSREPSVVVNDRSGVVALLPSRGRSDAITADGRWMVGIERRRSHWEVVVRGDPAGAVLAAARPSWQPMTYRISLGPNRTYRLRKQLLRDRWVLSDARHPVAVVTIADVWSIDVPKGTASSRISLLVVLTLATIKADRSIPAAAGPSTPSS